MATLPCFQGNLYGPMALQVRQKFPLRLVFVHGWLFPEMLTLSSLANLSFRRDGCNERDGFVLFEAQLTYCLCKGRRRAAVKCSSETTRGSRHGNAVKFGFEILVFVFPQDTKLGSAQNFY